MSTCRCSSQRINMTTAGLFSLSQPSSLPLCQHSRQRNHRVSHFKTADLAKSWYFFFAGLTSALAISSVTFLNWLSMGPWKSFWQHLAMWPIHLYYNNTPWACFLILLVFIIPCNCFLLYVINKCICLHFLYPIWVKILFQATGLKKKKKFTLWISIVSQSIQSIAEYILLQLQGKLVSQRPGKSESFFSDQW